LRRQCPLPIRPRACNAAHDTRPEKNSSYLRCGFAWGDCARRASLPGADSELVRDVIICAVLVVLSAVPNPRYHSESRTPGCGCADHHRLELIAGLTQRRNLAAAARQRDKIVIHVAETAENLLRGGSPFELLPIMVVSESLLQPSVMNAPVADKEVKIIYSAYNTFSAASFVYADLLGVVPCFVSETGDSLTCTEMQRLASSPALFIDSPLVERKCNSVDSGARHRDKGPAR
jgi:hypothetical protein